MEYAMRNPVLNILTILSLLCLCGVSAFVLTIFVNPDSALNPFPPPTEPAALVLPTDTPTVQSMPPTWTPQSATSAATIIPLAPSATPLFTPTTFTLPTYTPTATPTETPTETPLPTDTEEPPEPTSPPAPTKTPKPIKVDLQLTDLLVTAGNASTSPVELDISVANVGTSKVTAKLTNNFTRKMTKITWTCVAATGVTCKGSSAKNVSSFSTTLTMSGGGTVTLHVVVNFTPSAPPKTFNTSAQINGSGNVVDVDATNNAKSTSIAP
jgi:hypothetical protein